MTIVNPYAITPEWKAVGLQFQDKFANAIKSALNGLKTVGSPVVSDGMRLDGSTQYGYFDAPRFYAAPGSTIELKFYAGFEFGDSSNHYIFDGTPNLELSLIKASDNKLRLYIAGISIFNSTAFGAYWLPNEDNSLIVSMTSTDTTAYLNGVKVIDSDASAFGNFHITRITLGAKFDGTNKSPINFKSFRYFNKAFTDADCEKLYDGRLFDELDPKKATLFAGLRSSYTNGAGEKVTPVLINGETQEMLYGSDGKTAGEYPDDITPRGWRFDGAAFGNAGDRDEFTFADTTDLRFSVCACIQSSDNAPRAGIISKFAGGSNGEWALFQLSGNLYFYLVDSVNTDYMLNNANIIKTGKLQSLVVTYSGSGVVSGLNMYDDGIYTAGATSTGGSYVKMVNSSQPVLVGQYGSFFMPAKSNIRLVQIPPMGVELSPAQARIWNARARRLKNV